MKLRPRLALTAAALTLPLALLVVGVEARARTEATGELLLGIVGSRLAGEGRERCEQSPERWSRPPPPGPPPPGAPPPPFPPPGAPPFPPPFPRPSPPPEMLPPEGMPPGLPPPLDVAVFPYDEALHGSAPTSPPLDRAPERALVDAVRAGATSARGTFEDGDGRVGDQVLVHAAASGGRCAYVLVRRLRPPLGIGLVPMLVRSWAPPLLAMLLAIVLGLAPIVRRIRRLAARVRASADDRYRAPIALDGDDEIAELGAAFDHAAGEVRAHLQAQERREQTLRDFLANTTHDVMTPLTVLQGHLAALQTAARDGGALDPATVAAAIDESHYMASLVHNLGVAARLEAGEPHVVRAPVDLGALVLRVIGRHRPIARQRAIALEAAVPESPLVVDGDETFLEQAVSNLVDNALRYPRAGGHVAVVLEPRAVEPPGAARFRLRVLDDGPGVPGEELARIALRSVRGEAARTRHPDGRGLGLAIARKVAALHAMELSFARSELGGLQVDLEGALRGG